MIVRLMFSKEYVDIHKERIEKGEYDFPRDCLACGIPDAVVGHGRRSRQCHGPDTTQIVVRRGRCARCGKTFTFLPSFARPYSRYAVDVVRTTVINFIADAGARLIDAAPDFRDTNQFPDIKTLYNWLHVVADRLEGAGFEFVSCGIPTDTLHLPQFSCCVCGTRGSMRNLIKRLHNSLSALKEKFDAGVRVHFQDFLFHAGSFFQALFPGIFAVSVM